MYSNMCTTEVQKCMRHEWFRKSEVHDPNYRLISLWGKQRTGNSSIVQGQSSLSPAISHSNYIHMLMKVYITDDKGVSRTLELMICANELAI